MHFKLTFTNRTRTEIEENVGDDDVSIMDAEASIENLQEWEEEGEGLGFEYIFFPTQHYSGDTN